MDAEGGRESMICKGNHHGDPEQLCDYLLTPKANETVEILDSGNVEFRGNTPAHFRLNAKRISLQTKTSKADHKCYHIQISPDRENGRKMTRPQFQFCVETALRWRKLSKHAWMSTIHHTPEGPHIHLEVSRFDPESGKMKPNKLWAKDHDSARLEMEQTLGHPITPNRNLRKADIRKQLTALLGLPLSEFLKEVKKLGYVISYGGNQKPYHVVDQKAVAHPLHQMIIDGEYPIAEGKLREFLKPVEFPTMKEAIKLQRDKLNKHKEEEQRIDKDLEDVIKKVPATKKSKGLHL